MPRNNGYKFSKTGDWDMWLTRVDQKSSKKSYCQKFQVDDGHFGQKTNQPERLEGPAKNGIKWPEGTDKETG